MRSDLAPLCPFGHVASHRELLEAFCGQESAILPFRLGGLRTVHLRPDVYACAHLTELELSAAWCGGKLDCVTVLAESGLAVGPATNAETHLRLKRGDSRAAARRHEHAPMSHMHWSELRTPMPTVEETNRAARSGQPIDRLRVPFREALRQAMTTCLDYADSAKVIEAIVSRELCPVEDVAHAVAAAPRRLAIALRELDGIPPEVEVALTRLR